MFPKGGEDTGRGCGRGRGARGTDKGVQAWGTREPRLLLGAAHVAPCRDVSPAAVRPCAEQPLTW